MKRKPSSQSPTYIQFPNTSHSINSNFGPNPVISANYPAQANDLLQENEIRRHYGIVNSLGNDLAYHAKKLVILHKKVKILDAKVDLLFGNKNEKIRKEFSYFIQKLEKTENKIFIREQKMDVVSKATDKVIATIII